MNFFEPIYSLPMMRYAEDEAKAMKASAGFGGGGAPLGNPYVDFFRLNRYPGDNALIGELIGTAYACANLNADGVAKSKLRLYVRTKRGQEKSKDYLRCKAVDRKILYKGGEARSPVAIDPEEVLEVTNHPVLELMRNPEPDPDNGLCPYDHFWLTQIYLDVLGRAFWMKEGKPRPDALWCIPPQAVRENRDTKTGKLLSYQITLVNGPKDYDPSQIIKFHNPDPSHPHSGGFAPMQAANRYIQLLGKGDAHINALLENGGFPGAVWSPKGDSEGGGIGAAEAERVRSVFRRQFAQAGRGGLMVTESPGTLNPFSYKPEEIIEVERAKWYETKVCGCFGVPDTKLQRNAANLAAAKTADYAHSKDAILPRCTRIEEILNVKLLPMYDTSGRFFFGFDSPIPDDQVFELEQQRVAGTLGAVTRNETRRSIGLPDMRWGDLPTIANNITTVDPDTGLIDPSSTEMAKQAFAAQNPSATGAPKNDADADSGKAMLTEMKLLVAELRGRDAQIPARLGHGGAVREAELVLDSGGRPDVGNLAGPGRSSVGGDLREERRKRALERLRAAGYSAEEISAMSNGKHQHAEL